MPLPQVNDRLKEVPAQALRTIFASIGQLLLIADRLRARAAGQLSGSGDATAARPSDQAAAAAPPAAAPPATHAAPAATPAQDAGDARWRTLDKTGNVRLLDGEEDLAVPGPASQATAEPVAAAAEYTPTEVVPAVSVPPEPAAPEPPLAGTAASSPAGLTSDVPTPAGLTADVPAPADLIPDAPAPAHVPAPANLTPDAPAPAQADLDPAEPAEPAPAGLTSTEPADPTPAGPAYGDRARAGLTPAESAAPPALAGETLPVPNYDQLTVASLRARLRVLDTTQVQVLLDYEKAHEGRPAVVTMFERRLTKLSEGS
jgi:hypothetical protein